MSNTIKLKRGSGSDPSASDLVAGEVAVRTDNGKLFTKKDDGTVAEISGGGIDDGDKGDITVSNSGATFTIDSGVVSTSKMATMPTDRILGREASGTGSPQYLTATEARSVLNVENGATADQTASEIVALIADQTIAPSTIDMEDGEKIKLGASDDLEIFHGASSDSLYPNFNIIRTTNTNLLLFEVANASNGILFNHRTGNDLLNFENMLTMTPNSGVDLFFNGARKLKTVTGGVEITGTCTATDFSGDGSNLTGVTATVANGAIYENSQTITADYTITNGKNAMSAGPIEISSGVTVTVGSGETYTIV